MKNLFLLLFSLSLSTVFAQQSLNLDDCLEIAIKNNIGLKEARNSARIAGANEKQAKLDYLPSVSANVNYDFFFGNTFDNSAARQVSATTKTSSPYLAADLNVFNGFQRENYRKETLSSMEAAQSSIEAQTIDVKTDVVSLYLSVVTSKESLKVIQQRIKLLESQLERADKRAEYGVSNMEQVYNLRSQIANERLTYVNMDNELKRNKLNLIQLLQLDPLDQYTFSEIAIDPATEVDLPPYEQMLRQSIKVSPHIQQAQSNLAASQYAYEGAKGGRYPTLSVRGRVGSSYSSNGALNPESGGFEQDASLMDQLNYNAYEYVGLNLSIPVFRRGQTNTNIKIAKIGTENAVLRKDQAELDWINRFQQAYLDLLTARSTFEASSENLNALNQAYSYTETSYENGNVDFYTYLEALNNKNRAEINLVNAQYAIALRKKILDIYAGI